MDELVEEILPFFADDPQGVCSITTYFHVLMTKKLEKTVHGMPL